MQAKIEGFIRGVIFVSTKYTYRKVKNKGLLRIAEMKTFSYFNKITLIVGMI